MNTKAIRENLNLTQKEFSVLFNIPYSTVRNWDARDCMPAYVWSLVDKVISYRKYDFIKDLRLFPDNRHLTNEQIKEEFKKALKDEAQTLIWLENEEAL